jgi:alginate O-acetyltransferase complex protein AlgI
MIQFVSFWALLLLAVPVFWVIPSRWRFGFLAIASASFLAWIDPVSVVVLGLWGGICFFGAPAAGRSKSRLAPTLIVGLLSTLAGFKYIPPLVVGLVGHGGESLLIPLGISYYVFKLVHYVAEVAKGNIENRDFQQYLTYLFLFPTFSAGPIERFDHFLSNQDSDFSSTALVEGGTRIVHGLVKRFVLAEFFLWSKVRGPSAEYLLDNLEDLDAWYAWRFLIARLFYFYFEFSGYTDIAIGSSRLFGLRIMENFSWPLLATSITEFWKRWHMTLSGWCQTYVYMPMIGLTRNPYVAIYSTFLVMGLWHVGSAERIWWGLYHASGVIAHVKWRRLKARRGWRLDNFPSKVVGILLTLTFVAGAGAFTAGFTGPFDGFRLLAKCFFVNL